MEYSKKTGVILWACAAAASAGILGVALILRVRQQQMGGSHVRSRLRDVQDVLDDVYQKIHEIEDHLPNRTTARARRSALKVVGNGNPI